MEEPNDVLNLRELFPSILSLAVVILLTSVILLNISPVFAADNNFIPKRELSSGAEINYPPFSLVDASGEASGFSIELLRASLEAMNVNVKFRTGPWSKVRGWLERSEIDVLPLVGRRPDREALFDFTVPYMSLHGAIVIRDNETGIRNLLDLRGRKVTVMEGDNAEEFLRQEDRGIEIHTTPTFEIALQNLSQGKCDAVVIQRLVGLRLIQKTGLTDLHIIDRHLQGFKQDFCFAVSEGDRETLALLNEGLAIVMADGTHSRLHSKWFGALQLPSKRPIIIGGDRNYPPYEFIDEKGNPSGYNVDLARAIAREMSLNIDIRLGVWGERINALENGRIDLLLGMYYSKTRDVKFDFTQPHILSHYVTIVRKGEEAAAESLEDLSGKTIAVEENDILEDFANENGLTNQIVAVADQEAALRQLSEGKHDCAVVTLVTAIYLIEKNGWTNLVIGKTPILTTEYCYAASKGQKALLARFSDGLKALDSSGEYRQIHDKWLGVYKNDTTTLKDALTYSAFIIVPLLLVLFIAFTWSWSLRKQVAEKTRAVEDAYDKFRYFFESTNVPKSITLLTGEISPNKAFADFLGYSQKELQQKPWRDITPAEDIADCEKAIGPLLSGEKKSERFEKRYIHKNGGYLWADMNIALRKDVDGKPMYFMTTIVDITERKRSLLRIEHLNKLLRTIKDINQLILREQNKETLIKEGCRLLVANRGYRSAIIILTDEKALPLIWTVAGVVDGAKDLTKVLEEGKIPSCCQHMEENRDSIIVRDEMITCADCPIEATCANNQSLYAPLLNGEEMFGYLIAAGEREMVVDEDEKDLFTQIAGDIAYALSVVKIQEARLKEEMKSEKLQDQLFQSQKMESVGRLAGGIAHDFNNMLSVIIGYSELAAEKIDPKDPLHDDLDEILVAAQRSADITRQLLAFARQQTIAPRVLDLNETVESTLKMLRRLIGENIELFWEPGANLRTVKVDPSQLNQILTNLCVNAQDAISNVGRISIKTNSVCCEEEYCANHSEVNPGQYALLSVSDDGAGMDKKTVPKIFEPFFTTKEVGKGTGLGLAMIYGIVKQNKGFINVTSEPGEGTTFELYFPCYTEPFSEVKNSDPLETPVGMGETVLIVEDEVSILRMVRKILKGMGYNVLHASAPEAALSIAESHCGQINLLVTDVVMPEMNGYQLSKEMLAIQPDLKVLFMSGYTADVIANQGVLDKDIAFIQKPFSNQDLAMKVREALNMKVKLNDSC